MQRERRGSNRREISDRKKEREKGDLEMEEMHLL